MGCRHKVTKSVLTGVVFCSLCLVVLFDHHPHLPHQRGAGPVLWVGTASESTSAFAVTRPIDLDGIKVTWPDDPDGG